MEKINHNELIKLNNRYMKNQTNWKIWYYFKNLRILHKLTYSKVSNELWISRLSYYNREIGKTQFTIIEFILLLHFYSITIPDFLSSISDPFFFCSSSF